MLQNETTSTVVIVPATPDQDHNEEELQYHEPYQPPLPNGTEEKAEEKVEIRTPYKVTPQIIVVRRIVDRILVGVNHTAFQKTSKGIPKDEAELETEDVRNESTADGESARTEEEAVEPREDIRVGEPSSDNHIDKEHLRRHVGYQHGIAGSDLHVGSVQVIWENGTVEGPEDKNGGEGEGEGNGNEDERRDASTSGPGPDDEGGERVAVLMGWTALVGVVGILAIAPAG